MTIIEDRLAEIEQIALRLGGHDENTDHEMCVMEAVAYVAGEPWSDHPQCACPVLTRFMVAWNDGSNDEQRQELKRYIPRLVGTRSTPEVETRRSWLACDWLVRVFTPTWLRKAGLVEDAEALEALPELTTTGLVVAALPTIRQAQKSSAAAWDAARAAARDAAWDAAWAAAWAAARDAAGDAARAAAGDAAWDAAWAAAWAAARDAAGDAARAAAGDAAWDAARAAARDAARDAAGDAAWAAAWAAARDAARDALAPTVAELRASAFDLLDRMIAA